MTWLEYVYHVSLLIAAVVAIWRSCHRPGKAVSCLCLYMLYGLLNEWATLYSIQRYQNNYMLANLYDHLSLLILLSFYHQSLNDRKGRRAIGIVLVCCAFTLLLYLSLFPGFRLQHQLDLEHIKHLLIIIIALYAVYRLVIADEEGKIHEQFLFWISLQFIGYHFLCLWCRSVVHPLNLESKTVLDRFFGMLLIANTLHYTLLALLLVLFKKNKSPVL